jgi:hypothetical protein
VVSLEENLERITKTFHQENFSELIDKCKMLMETIREDKIYIEKLKEEIVIITGEKNKIIEKTKEIIEELKGDNLLLIEKIQKFSSDKEKSEKANEELLKRKDDIKKKTFENRQLKNEIEKAKSNITKETNRIEVYKDKEINILKERLKQQVKLEIEIEQLKKENYKIQNALNEIKIELNRKNTVSIEILIK